MNSARLSLAERASYGLGDLGFSLPYNMAGAFLLYYYTNVVHLPAAAVGTIFLIARLLDAVIDIAVGVAVDKTRSRWGRAKPYILFMAVPYAVVFIAVFSVPATGLTAQLIYAFVTFKALGILMSLGSIPYTALLPMMTRGKADRLQLGAARSIGTSISVIVGTAATMPLVGLFGGGDEQRGFMATAILFAGVSLAALLMLFRNCRERFEDSAPANFKVLPVVGQMLRNRAWLVCFIFCLLYFIRFGGMLGITAFFAIEVLRQPWMISLMLPAISGMLVLAAFIAPPIFSRTGIRAGSVGAIAVSVVLFAILPMFESNPAAFLAAYVLACITTSLTITAIFAMAADSVNWHELKFGTRNEGILSAGISIATKVGMAIGSAGVAFVLAWAAYDPDAVSDLARGTIRWAYYIIPITFLILQGITVLFWPMDGVRASAN